MRPRVRTRGPHQTTHSTTSPSHEVHWASLPGRHGRVRERRAQLRAGRGQRARHLLHGVPARGDLGEVEDPAGPARHVGDAGGASGRVEPRADPAGALAGRGGELLDDPVLCGRVGPVPQVDRGDAGGQLVGVDGPHPQVETGHRHRVGADAAAEVVDGVDARGAEPLGVLGGDAESGGLLQAVGGEHHAAGELAELVDRPGPQPRLVEGGGDEVGVEARVAQPLLQRERRGLVVRRERLQQTPALAGGQPSQQGQVHVAHCCVCRGPRSRAPVTGRCGAGAQALRRHS